MVLVELVIGLTALAVTGLATRLPPRGSMAVDSEAFPFGHRAALGATSRIVRHEPFSKRQRRRREIWRRLRSAEAFRFCAKGCAPLVVGARQCFPRGGVRGGVPWTVRSERRRWPKAATQFPLTPASQKPGRVNESEAGSKEELRRPTAALPRPATTTPLGHRLRLPRPRVSPAFLAAFLICAIGHPTEFRGVSAA
jgi:hypothetical protein